MKGRVGRGGGEWGGGRGRRWSECWGGREVAANGREHQLGGDEFFVRAHVCYDERD